MSAVEASNNHLEFIVSKAPSVSFESYHIFREQNLILPVGVLKLKNKVNDLVEIRTRFQQAQENPTRDKIISMLALLVVVAIVAGGVLGTYYLSKIPTRVAGVFTGITPLATFFVVYGLTAYYNHKWSDYQNRPVVPLFGYLFPIVISIIGPFIPAYMTFGNRTRLEKVAQEKGKEIADIYMDTKKLFADHATKMTHLQAFLNDGVREIEKSLRCVRNLEIPSPETEKSLTAHFGRMKKASDELNAAISFFNK